MKLRLLPLLLSGAVAFTACEPQAETPEQPADAQAPATTPAAPADTAKSAPATPSAPAKADSTAPAANPNTTPEAQAAAKAAANAPLSEPDRRKATADSDPDPEPNEFVQVEFDATPLNLERVRAAIVWPADLKKAGIGGTVYLKVLIDKDGWYKSHIVRSSPDPRLSAAVVEQIKKVRYSPARNAGQPVKVWTNFEYTFK